LGLFDQEPSIDEIMAEAAEDRKKEMQMFDELLANIETEFKIGYYSFVIDTAYGQGAGVVPKLHVAHKRGWEIVTMSAVASDAAPGMRELHVLIRFPKLLA